MLNVLKTALIYTGLYFVFCILWVIFLIGVQVFWKPVLMFFFLVLALLTFRYFRSQDGGVADYIRCKTQDWMPPSVAKLRAAMAQRA